MSAEAKHTPGPWSLETVQTACGICHKIGPFPWRPGKTRSACIYADYPSHDGSSPVDVELLANARLIAAAPDLLEALKLTDAMLSGANMNAKVVERKARAAIAKAEPPA